MTENEAKSMLEQGDKNANEADCTYEEYLEAIEMGRKALEEIQQYRAIGTVEDIQKKMEELERWHTDKINENIKNPFAYTSTLICHNCDHKDDYIEELESEIEEYRAIGSVEGIKGSIETNYVLLHAYEEIGTIEELKALKNKHIGKDNMVISSSDLMKILNSDSEELKQYKEVGTVEECRVAVERMKPKKAKGLRICNQACCPNCNTVVLDDEFWMLDEYTYYCDSCGQAVKGIDWSE